MNLSLIERTTTIDLIAEMSRNHEKIDAMTLARKFEAETGKHIDRHEFSDYLAELRSRNFLKVVNPSGFVTYDLNK